MESKLSFSERISAWKGKSWLWVMYPILSILFIAGIVTFVAQTAFFISKEIEKTFVGQATLEQNLLRLNIDGYNEIARHIGLPVYTPPTESEE